jgi:hypothetical protein
MVQNVLTVGDIANRLGEPLHRVEYVLRTRRQLRPQGRVGNARIYSESDLQFIASELRRIDAEKGISNE